MSRERERALNRAIADASPHAGFEAYANAYVELYDAAVSVTIGSREFVGRERVFDALVSLSLEWSPDSAGRASDLGGFGCSARARKKTAHSCLCGNWKSSNA